MKIHLITYLLVIVATAGLAQTDKEKQSLFRQDIEKLNELVGKRVVGSVDDFLVQDNLAMYAGQSHYLIYADFKAHTSASVRLTDSFLYSLVYNKEQVAEIEAAIELHKEVLDLDKRPGHEATDVGAFAFYNNRIYLLYSVINFYGMKKQDSKIVTRAQAKSVFFYEKFLVELKVTSEGLLVERTRQISNEDNTGWGFDIVDDVPALFFKSKVGDKDLYEYIKLPGEWKRQVSEQAFPDMMSVLMPENHFYNQYTLNHNLNILINNSLKKRLKIATGTQKVGIWSASMAINKNIVYVIVFNNSQKEMSLYKVDLENGKSTLLNTYKCAKEYNRYSIKCLYVDRTTNLLYLLDINDDKQLIIVDAVKL
jgi:hypothetical protein